MDNHSPTLRAIGVDPAIITMGVGVVEFLGYRRDIRLVAEATKLHGANSQEVMKIPCDIPHINLLTTEHWDVRNSMGSLARYMNPGAFAKTPDKDDAKNKLASSAYEVLPPSKYTYVYNSAGAHRDSTARMVGQHSLFFEKYMSMTGKEELPALLVENQQDQIKHGKFDYRAPIYMIANSFMSSVRAVDASNGDYGRVVYYHSKKWGIDRKSPSSKKNETEYHQRKDKSVYELYELLAANGLTEWIDFLNDTASRGFKLDDRADAVLLAIHWMAGVYDTYKAKHGIKHTNTIDPMNGYTQMPDILLNPMGRKVTAAKKEKKKKKLSKEDLNIRKEKRDLAFEKHMRERKRAREETIRKPVNEKPHKKRRVINTSSSQKEITDLTVEDGGYISDEWVEAQTDITYKDVMKSIKSAKRHARTKPSFNGTLDVSGSGHNGNRKGQSKIERFFKPTS
jgi:hypothetical protein